jgi:hypothetical protein
MDLLEDDGSTDIQGSVTRYDYGSSAVPEPSEILPLSTAMVTLVWLQIRRRTMQFPRREVKQHE